MNLCEVLSAFVGDCVFLGGDLLLPQQQLFANERIYVCSLLYLF